MNTFFKKTDKSITKSEIDDSKFIISGKMSVPVVDFENEVISTKAYPRAVNTVKERYAKGQAIPMFIEHRRKELSLPVGKVIDAWHDDNGLYFKAEIANGSIGEPIRELIKGGYLYSVSIGGDALKTQNYFDHKLNRDVKSINDMEIRELSLTGLPVNQEAVFSLEKSMNKTKGEVKTLMKTLDSAIDTQAQIFDLEKAVDADNLDEQSLNRIKQALNNLAALLKIDISADTTSTEQAPAASSGVAENKNSEQNTANQATSEIAPAKEETAQKEPTRKVVDANSQNDLSEDEDVVEDENEKSMVKEDRLDEINSKLDQLLGKKGGDIEKDEYAVVADEDDEHDENESEDEEEEEHEEGDEDEDEDEEYEEEDKGENKKMKKNKFLKKSTGGENMEMLKCRGCGSDFEKGDYDAKFCTHCGDRLEKSIVEDTDIVCEDCGSVFEKSEEYEIHYCPKCGKSMKDSAAMAVAPAPKGHNVEKEDVSKMKVGTEDAGAAAMAVAPNPKGADVKVEPETAKETGSSVKQFGDKNYIEANAKERTDMKDEDINDARPSGKPLLAGFDASKVASYGQERIGKSVATEGKQTLVPEVPAVTEKKVEKSVASQEDVDRSFARLILKK